jgi:AcrR family transcriptional regulator
MVKRVKRHYDNTARHGQAALTQARILDTARALFAERGLDRVTIEMVAAAAEVSSATIYSRFKSKAGLLKALMEASIFNNRYQTLAGQADAVTDPVDVLRVTASIARAIYDGEKEQLGLVRGASAFSSELREVEQLFERLRYDLQAARAQRLWRGGAIRPGLTLRQTRDILWMFTGRDMYRMLVVERGWTSNAYEYWLFATLTRALLVEHKT